MDIKEQTGWVGSTSYAQPQGKGDYPGAKCKMFLTIWGFNQYFKKNSHLLVIDVSYIPVLFGLFTSPVVMYTNQLSPEEQQDMQEVSREIEFTMAKRRAAKSEAQAKLKAESEAAQQEKDRLVLVGAKYEARVKHMKSLSPSEQERKNMESTLNKGDADILFVTKAEAFENGWRLGKQAKDSKETTK